MHFSLIGYPLSHSMSPFIHNSLFALRNLPHTYKVNPISKDFFSRDIKTLLSSSKGINVTIPYKEDIISFTDELCGRAKMYKSVNTLDINNGIVTGHNTDCDGFVMSLKSNNIPLSGRTVILGAGGVSRMFAFESAFSACNTIIVCRNVDRGNFLKNEICCHAKNADISVMTFDELEKSNFAIDLLINGTPIGMYPLADEMPVSKHVVKRSKAVFDSIYNPRATTLIKAAKSGKIQAVNGMSMLVWQAEFAQRIWFGNELPDEDVNLIIERTNDAMKSMFTS